MSGKVLFACSKCFSRHPFEELSSGRQLCKNCLGTVSISKCSYCRSEFQPDAKSQSACKKCEYNLSKYGKPNACECCKIVAAFGNSKCLRCASYEAKFGPPVQCEECKQRSAFDRHDENKKVNGKLLCWLCTCAFKRAVLKAQQEGRIPKKRPHERSHRNSDSGDRRKSSRSGTGHPPDVSKSSASGGMGMGASGLDLPDKILRIGGGNGAITAPAHISIDPNSADHVVAITNLKEKISSLERRLQMKDKELLEKDKLLTELKGQNFEKENDMRKRLKEVDRLHDMKVENLNRKVTSLLREVAGLKRTNKKNGNSAANKESKEKQREKSISPKEDLSEDKDDDKEEKGGEKQRPIIEDDDRDDKDSSSSDSDSPLIN